MAEKLVFRGIMRGHTDVVTAIATPKDNSNMVVTASRDKSIILWHLTKEDNTYGIPRRRLTGHSHYVEDVALSADCQFALSGSWDSEIRMWDLYGGTSVRRFVGHSKDVLSVAFSPSNSHIVSGSRDRTIKVWTTVGECTDTIQDIDAHSDWVSCVRYTPNTIVSASWDRTVKVWNSTDCKLMNTLVGHTGYISTIAVSADGSLCASGGNGDAIIIWDLIEGKKLCSLNASVTIHAMCINPPNGNSNWLCAATDYSIMIWDLESKKLIEDLKLDLKTEEVDATTGEEKIIYCQSLTWSADGRTLFSGYTDGVVRVWTIERH